MRVPGSVPAVTLVVALASTAEAAVIGRILDTDGSPVSGATVEALAHEDAPETGERRLAGRARRPIVTTTSAPDGSFRLDAKRPFAWVQAVADDHAPAIALADDGEPMQLLLTRAPLRTGRLTAGGKPVGGATVYWFSDEGAERLTRSAADGSFDAPDPARARGQIAVRHPDYAPQRTHFAGESKPSLDQSLEPGLRLAGLVVEHASGKPVAGARVWLDDIWPVADTDAKGAFTITHAPADWANLTARTRQAVGIAFRKQGTPVVRLKPSRTLSGTVTDAATRRPLPGATVVVRIASGAILTANTDARGQYALSGLPPTRYQPYAGRPGYVSGPTWQGAGAGIDLRSLASARFDAAIKRSPMLYGRVDDDQRQPVEGAFVALGFKDTPNFYLGRGSTGLEFFRQHNPGTRSAPDGTFTLALPSEDATAHGGVSFLMKDRPLVAMKPGFAAVQAAVSNSTTRLAPLVVRLSRGIELHGRITGPDGRPVRDVAVTAAEEGSLGGSLFPSDFVLSSTKNEGWATSDAAGRFSLRVHPAVHHLSFRKAGFAPKLARGHDARAGQPLEVVLEPAATIRGRISRPDGRGVPEVVVQVASAAPMAGGESATTAADGSFEVGDLAAGLYQLRASHEEQAISVTRTVEAPATDVQIALGPSVTLRGRVLDAASRQPVPRFRIQVEGVGDEGPSSRTVEGEDAAGAFTIEDVATGEVDLQVTAEGYAQKDVDDLLLDEGIEPPALEIALEADAPIRGRVTSEAGAPLSDAYVSVVKGSDIRTSTGADEDGEYELRGLPPGDVTLSFTADGYVSEKRTVDTRHSPKVDVTLKRGLALRGEVVRGGAGVPNATVMARSSSQGATNQTGETDERGRFTIEGLVPGRYTVSAASRGQGSAKLEDVDAESAGPLRLTLDKQATAVLTGKVIGLPDGEIGMAMVMAMNQEEGASAQATIDSARTFRMAEAPAGRVSVRAYMSSPEDGTTRTSREVELTLAPGSETETVIEFANDITISGVVVRDGAPVPFVMVAFGSEGRSSALARTDARGAYQAIGLEPGPYQVQVSGDNVSYETRYVVASSAEFDIDITGGSLSGRVVQADGGTALSGVEVSYFLLGDDDENTPDGSVTSSAQGTFSQRSLREGRYRLITSKAGFGQAVRDVEVPRGGSAEVLIELTSADGVHLTVVDARDSRPLDAVVVVRDQARRVVANRHSGADEQGALNIPLADGSYLLSTSATGYGTVTVPVTSPTQGLRLGLTPGGTLAIESARDLRGRVRLVQPDGEEYVRCWCNGIAAIELKGRRTSVENVTPGRYTLELVDAQEAATPRPVLIREGQTTTVAIE